MWRIFMELKKGSDKGNKKHLRRRNLVVLFHQQLVSGKDTCSNSDPYAYPPSSISIKKVIAT